MVTSIPKLKLLVVVDHAVGRSGPHRNVVGSLNALSARTDIEVTLLTGEVDPSEPYAHRLLELRLGFRPHSLRHLIPNLVRLAKAVQNQDIIYVPTGLKSFLYAQPFRRGRKLIAGPNVSPLPIPGYRHTAHPWMVATMCNGWIEASQEMQKALSHRGVDPGKMTVIPHAIDTQLFSPQKRSPECWISYGLSPARIKILFVCNNLSVPRKGTVHLLEAFRTHAHLWRNADLIIVAHQDPSGLINSYKDISAIHFLGPKHGEELARLYASSDLCVTPSSWENFPFVVLEALASGTAVIAGSGGGIKEQIEHGESGILVDLTVESGSDFRPDASTRLAAAIGGLLQDESKRKELGRNARQRVLDHFTEKRLGQDLVNLFRAVLRGERQP